MSVVAFAEPARPRGLFGSRSVPDGHPDKICEQISDARPDAALVREAHAHATVEAAAKGSAS
jgi:S-adenosylmethionine synthetase